MSQTDPVLTERARQAAKILENPALFKVCEGCGSIVTTRTTSCPSCHAYQFDGSDLRIITQAKALARRDANSVLSTDLA
jgi:RNA polymerase subunit RPABC4/transcription elongation factor Spt4